MSSIMCEHIHCAHKQVIRAYKMRDISQEFAIRRLLTAVTKAKTEQPMKRSTVLPVSQLLTTMSLWGDNSIPCQSSF